MPLYLTQIHENDILALLVGMNLGILVTFVLLSKKVKGFGEVLTELEAGRARKRSKRMGGIGVVRQCLKWLEPRSRMWE